MGLLPLLRLDVGLQVAANGLRVLSQVEDPVDDSHIVLDEIGSKESMSENSESRK